MARAGQPGRRSNLQQCGAGLGPEGDRVYREPPAAGAVVAQLVRRMPEDAFFNRQVWRAADGSVVNTVKPTF